MSNQHDLSKHQISIKFPHEMWRQIEKAAADRKMSPGEYIRDAVYREVKTVELTAEDLAMIDGRVKKAKKNGRML